MKAIKSMALGHHEIITDVLRPSAKGHPGYVLVRTKFVGINHCDYFFVDFDFMFQENATIGSEYCGEIVEIAEEGCERFKVGDTIAGCVFISCLEVFPDSGCLAEYALVKGDAQFSLEALGPTVSEQEAAGLGIALSTAYCGLYDCMKLPWPGKELIDTSDTILIYGGATNTGMIAIQLAKLAGLSVITTCSPQNFDLMRSLGADYTFDYHDQNECVKQIRTAAVHGLKFVFNCFGADESPKLCGEVISDGGIYAAVAPWGLPQKEKDVTLHFVQGQKVLGEPFKLMGQVTPADQALFSDWKRFIPIYEELIRNGKLKLSPTSLVSGLDSVGSGLDSLRKWDNHARKLVCAM